MVISALHVMGPFPVADKHLRGSWLCMGFGLSIWRPTWTLRLSGNSRSHGRCGSHRSH